MATRQHPGFRSPGFRVDPDDPSSYNGSRRPPILYKGPHRGELDSIKDDAEHLRVQVLSLAEENEALKSQLAEVSKKQGDLENLMESMQHYFQSEQVNQG